MAGTNFGWTILVLLKANENFHSPIHFFFCTWYSCKSIAHTKMAFQSLVGFYPVIFSGKRQSKILLS